MSELKIETEENRDSYCPGETIRGKATWYLSSPGQVEINLLWYTRGKGTVDVNIVDSIEIKAPERDGMKEFTFTLPLTPYSFSGKLISLIWALEVILKPSDEVARQDIVMSPTGEEIILKNSSLPQ